MFNRLARLWGRKAGGEQDAVTPVGGQIDQEARQGDKDALDRSLERYRQQSAERERQWKEAQLKEIEAQSGPAATWPRLWGLNNIPRIIPAKRAAWLPNFGYLQPFQRAATSFRPELTPVLLCFASCGQIFEPILSQKHDSPTSVLRRTTLEGNAKP